MLRPAHWLKNFFVLAPLFFADIFNYSTNINAFSGFICFSLLSSAIYIFNDWCDIEADRKHKKKKLRPLASGAVSSKTGIFISILLLVLIFLIAYVSNFQILSILSLSIYLVVNLSYSLGLKQIPVLELLLVSSGFVLRLIFGALIIEVELSIWILVCTGLLSTLIVVGKRRADLVQQNDENFARRSLNGYNLEYLNQLLIIFSACVITSYLLFCASSYAVEKFGDDVLWTSIFVILGVLLFLKSLIVDGSGDDPVRLFLSSGSLQLVTFSWVVSFILVINF